MSENKEDFALHCLVKNEEARKRLGIKAGFFWTTAKKLSVAISRCIAAMDDKGYDEDDFKKPVRVNLPAIGDLPLKVCLILNSATVTKKAAKTEKP